MRCRLAAHRLAGGALGSAGRTASRPSTPPARSLSAASHEFSQKRLDAFLQAEIWSLGERGYSQITIEQIAKQHTPEGVAEIIHKELPPRFAQRLRQMENSCPDLDWKEIPGMTECYATLEKSFTNLRLVNFDTSDLSDFTDLVKDLRERHKDIVPQFARAADGLRMNTSMTSRDIDEWLDKIMTSRMGTEMLTAHYMSLLTDPDDNHIGIVDTKCNPRKICEEAIDLAKTHAQAQFGEERRIPKINLAVQNDIEFSFISKYLVFMVEELILNSISATLDHARCRGMEELPEIDVTVCEDPRRIGIQISDKAGGVPHPQRIWEYMYSSTAKAKDCDGGFRAATPLSGRGMGLPMCKLYATYLGGTLHLFSVPGVGTDVYMFLNRIDASGIVPPSIVAP